MTLATPDRSLLAERFLRPEPEQVALVDLACAVVDFLYATPAQPGERCELARLREKQDALLRLFRGER